jgi:hypothetical protein
MASKKYDMTHPERAAKKREYYKKWYARKKEEKLRNETDDRD